MDAAAVASSSAMEEMPTLSAEAEKIFPLVVKWNGQEIAVSHMLPTALILELKNYLCEQTKVLPERQKLLGGKGLADDKIISDVFKPNQKVMMMGTPEEQLAAVLADREDDPNILNDFEMVEEENIPYYCRPDLLDKIKQRVETCFFQVCGEFREGKKLLVLDIDFTVFDMRSVGQNGQELMRPFLHELLHVAYRNFDIAFWSATSMVWIIAKMEELGIKANHQSGYYRIAALIDSSAMISIVGPRKTYKVKPLGVIWGKFPQFSEKNTLIVDDLSQNFLMNPSCGLKISQYRNAFVNKDTDKELVTLAEYLEAIAETDDFTRLNHKRWAQVAKEHSRALRRTERDYRRASETGANKEEPS